MIETRNSSLWGIALIVIVGCSLSAQGKYGGGTGGPNDPYLIFDANQMNAIGANPGDWDKHFLLCADIDLGGFTGPSFNIIGTYYPLHPFIGVFDGSGHTISNFNYAYTSTGRIGLFGYVRGSDAEIKNLGLINPNVDAGTGDDVGSLVGHLREGTIINCYVQGGSVAGNRLVGGLVGDNTGTITDCYSTGSVAGNNYVGGLVGGNFVGAVTDCYSNGSVSGKTNVGGLVGINDYGGTITSCYSTASVSGDDYVGGLVGFNYYGAITNSYSEGNVSGTSDVGGLVGWNYDTISNCYSTGSVSGDELVGGLVGGYGGGVTDSFWDIETSGQSISAGGTGKTTAEMQMQVTFTDVGWDFENIWWILEGTGYPKLWWENKYGGGSGTAEDPYLIYTAEELNFIGLFVCELDKHFLLCADIDLSGFTGTSFNIIGIDWDNPFTGVFDGNGHTISNFTYDSNDRDYIGLFGYIQHPNAEIKNLGLIDPNVDAGTGNYVGSLVGLLINGTVTNCYIEGGSVVGLYIVGGLVGGNYYGTITNCYSESTISGDRGVGGLVGDNEEGTISNCYASGSASGNGAVGGLVGRNDHGIISNSYSTGDVSGVSDVGGLVGYCSHGMIANCYATGSVTGYDPIGGLVGWSGSGSAINSFWDIQTSGQTTSAGGTGLPTTEMQMQVTFMDAGWDFVGERINGSEDIWMMTCEGMSYPKLSWWQPVLGDYFCPDGVDMIDMEHLALHWLDTGCDETNDYCDWAEISNDSTIDFTDFAILADNWLAGR